MVVVMSLSSITISNDSENFTFHAVKNANRSVRRMVVAFYSVPGSGTKISGCHATSSLFLRQFIDRLKFFEGFAHEHR
jgi:hypothetical protein